MSELSRALQSHVDGRRRLTAGAHRLCVIAAHLVRRRNRAWWWWWWWFGVTPREPGGNVACFRAKRACPAFAAAESACARPPKCRWLVPVHGSRLAGCSVAPRTGLIMCLLWARSLNNHTKREQELGGVREGLMRVCARLPPWSPKRSGPCAHLLPLFRAGFSKAPVGQSHCCLNECPPCSARSPNMEHPKRSPETAGCAPCCRHSCLCCQMSLLLLPPQSTPPTGTTPRPLEGPVFGATTA